jgi:hypothetical protein
MLANGNRSAGVWLWPAVSILMLMGMTAEAMTHITPKDSDGYLLRCKKAIEDIPTTLVGPTGNIWSGKDTDVPPEATKLLRPNKILSREYVQQGGENASVSLLIVHCSDARDLQGHYPPRCYPASGHRQISEEQRTWHLPGMDINGMAYEFSSGSMGGTMTVYNFFVTPRVPGAHVSHPELDGAICRDMADVYKSGEDYQRRYFGAAEFQIVGQGQATMEQMDQAFVDLLTPNEDVIRTLMNRESGGK